MITVRMTEEEYERFLEFRGAEKYAQSVRAQQGFLFCASKKAAWAACA